MWILILLGCGVVGGDAPFGDCASDDDCAGERVCVGPNPTVVCGVPPREECASDAECGTGLRCHGVADACSPDGVGSTCGMPCDAASCGAGFVCVDGACAAASCEDGAVACGAWQVCDPGRMSEYTPTYNRHHGCFEVSCTSDDACADELRCVTGYCQEGLGTCQEAMVVP